MGYKIAQFSQLQRHPEIQNGGRQTGVKYISIHKLGITG